MAIPSPKSPAIEAMLRAITGVDRVHCIENDLCATCGASASEFDDELSRKEYTISGMCQVCQDKTFGVDPFDISRDYSD